MTLPDVTRLPSDWRWRVLRQMRAVTVLSMTAAALAMAVAALWSVGTITFQQIPTREWGWSVALIVFAGFVAFFAAVIWSVVVAGISRLPWFRTSGPIRAIVGGAIAGACGGFLAYWLFFGWRDPIEWTLSLVKITTVCGAAFGLLMDRISAFGRMRQA